MDNVKKAYDLYNATGDRDNDGIPNAIDTKNNNTGIWKDQDNDGIPDIIDSTDSNTQGAMGDRDHDGIPNAVDFQDNQQNSGQGGLGGVLNKAKDLLGKRT
ncbi:hypothetical protein K493DRAFT_321058 [Basidiobolus meristosporus CBS 931.73]|uniref:Uncharacterized protein n=1 Tax=Basidiobolus meristosporus CBS 931.73 TaxID=1314790 RepID=A0A1Y1X2B0_9FUNG|nr:hypothetical protein K493DRAFT_321058 [Basidiobolus meristosporus CBS 931.73]|eukprot:ORX79464.1 hypothetical protein K493DRAFT_321058 [Basidiobolus meristosporus CBS 931.73]